MQTYISSLFYLLLKLISNHDISEDGFIFRRSRVVATVLCVQQFHKLFHSLTGYGPAVESRGRGFEPRSKPLEPKFKNSSFEIFRLLDGVP